MNDRTAAPARSTERTQGSRRGGASGRLTVGEYVGQPAGDAAQAVRRAGLRPGLERSFGCEAELVGQVVAQEPPAGGDLARNGMVTLYVGAPGVAPGEEETDAAPNVDLAPAPIWAVPPQAVGPETGLLPTPPRRRRSRKPGRAGRSAHVSDTPPDPVEVDQTSTGEEYPQVAAGEPAQVWASEAGSNPSAEPYGEEYDEGVADDLGDDELSHEEFVVHVDDLLAGRASQTLPGWRRVYPRRRPPRSRDDHGARAQLAAHPLLVRAAGGMLALWLVVGVAAALASHPSHPHTPAAPVARAQAPASREPVEPPPVKAKPAPRAVTAIAAPVAAREAHARKRPRRAASAKRPVPRPVEASARSVSTTRPAPSAGSAAPAAPPAQTQGGLFSP
jgi:PASTA domain